MPWESKRYIRLWIAQTKRAKSGHHFGRSLGHNKAQAPGVEDSSLDDAV